MNEKIIALKDFNNYIHALDIINMKGTQNIDNINYYLLEKDNRLFFIEQNLINDQDFSFFSGDILGYKKKGDTIKIFVDGSLREYTIEEIESKSKFHTCVNLYLKEID